MPEDVKEKVAQKLKAQGGISSQDIANFAGGKAEKTGDQLAEASTVNQLPKEAAADPTVAKIATTAETLKDELAKSLPLEEEIEITPADKSRFLEVLISGQRFTRPFTLFGGKVRGVVRSRTARESHALLAELRRQWLAGEISSDVEYGDRLRWGGLRFQLQEVNDTEYPPPAEPLLAQRQLDPATQKERVAPPAWVSEAYAFFANNQSEAFVAAIYREVTKFEKLYWALVGHADDQDFWPTAGATSA